MGASSQSDSANVAQDPSRGRSRQRGSQNCEQSRGRSKSKGKLMCFYFGKPRHFQKNCRDFKRDKGNVDSVEEKKISEERNTSAIAASEKELFISEQACVNLACDECTWVVDSNASFHLSPNRE